MDIDAFFTGVGGKAMQFILIFGILLNAIAMVAAASGAEQSFVSSMPSLFALDWVYSSTSRLRTVVSAAGFNPLGAIALILTTTFSILASIISILVTGYLTLAAFIINSIPSQLMPIGVFVAVGLTFVQLCVWYSLAKFMINILSNFFQRVL